MTKASLRESKRDRRERAGKQWQHKGDPFFVHNTMNRYSAAPPLERAQRRGSGQWRSTGEHQGEVSEAEIARLPDRGANRKPVDALARPRPGLAVTAFRRARSPGRANQ